MLSSTLLYSGRQGLLSLTGWAQLESSKKTGGSMTSIFITLSTSYRQAKKWTLALQMLLMSGSKPDQIVSDPCIMS